MKVVCINGKNKPKNIPDKNWVFEEEIYTIDKIFKVLNASQPGMIGVTLKEVSLPKDSGYEVYQLNRFRPATDEDFEALAAMEQLLEELEIGEFLTV